MHSRIAYTPAQGSTTLYSNNYYQCGHIRHVVYSHVNNKLWAVWRAEKNVFSQAHYLSLGHEVYIVFFLYQTCLTGRSILGLPKTFEEDYGFPVYFWKTIYCFCLRVGSVKAHLLQTRQCFVSISVLLV